MTLKSVTDPTTYHKISGPFKRGEDLRLLDIGNFVNPAVELLASADIWLFTEKIDGTNVRLIWDGHNLSYNGRTNNADLHKDLRAKLDSLFIQPGVEEYFEESFGEKEVILIGEGYGAGIQKGGGNYSPTKEFVGYDVLVNGKYLSYQDSRGIFARLHIPALTSLNTYPTDLLQGIDLVANGLYSGFGNRDFFAEGVVATTERPLYDNNGQRMIVKLKHDDLYDHPDLT